MSESKKISSIKWLIILLLVPFLAPNCVFSYGGVQKIFDCALIGSIAVTLFLYAVSMKSFSKFLIWVALFQTSLIISEISYTGTVSGQMRTKIFPFFMCMLLGYFCKYNIINLIKAIYMILWVYILLNAVSCILGPALVNESSVYFLGIRTRFTNAILVANGVGLLCVDIDKKKYLKYQVVLVMLTLFQLINQWVGTGLLTVFILYGVYFVLTNVKRFNKINMHHIVLVGIGLNILIVFLRIQNIFSFIIEDILHKDLSLTGRTEIWDSAFKSVAARPIWGYGMYQVEIVTSDKVFKYAHSQFIQLLLDSGIIGLIFFCVMLYVVAKQTKKYVGTNYVCALSATLFAIVVSMITEIATYDPYYLIILFLSFHAQNYFYEKSLKCNEGKES